MLIMTRQDEERLGLPQALEACRCQSPQGRKLKAKRVYYAPSDRESLQKEFDAIDRLKAFLHSNPQEVRQASVALGRFRDLHGTLSGLENHRLLEVTELFEIKQSLQLFRELSAMTRLLAAASVTVSSMPEAEAILDPGDRKTSGFYLYDDYSPRLAELRKQRALLEKRIEKNSETSDATMREEWMAERAALVASEDAEEMSVRAMLTDAMSAHLPEMKANFEAVGVLDFRLARGVLADNWQAGKPSILETGQSAVLIDVWHPVIEAHLKKRGTSFVRQLVTVRRGSTVLSGPNMGGKSVALKSMTLALALMQLGYFPPATSASTPLYDFVSYSSDHLDTTKRGLSSFGAEIVRIRDDIARSRQKRGLVIMDEPCRGTNPEEATALVGALIKFYSRLDSSFVIATHYRAPSGENISHVRIRGIRSEDLESIVCDSTRNGDIRSEDLNTARLKETSEPDQQAIRRIEALMDYRLEEVDGHSPVPTEAIRIAALLGLDKDVLALMEDIGD